MFSLKQSQIFYRGLRGRVCGQNLLKGDFSWTSLSEGNPILPPRGKKDKLLTLTLKLWNKLQDRCCNPTVNPLAQIFSPCLCVVLSIRTLLPSRSTWPNGLCQDQTARIQASFCRGSQISSIGLIMNASNNEEDASLKTYEQDFSLVWYLLWLHLKLITRMTKLWRLHAAKVRLLT